MNPMKVRDVIGLLSYAELKKLQHDLKTGGKHLKILVDDTVQRIEHTERKVCASCGTSIESDTGYTLLFGPRDLRKKATFCGLDCLEAFNERLRRVHP